MFCGLTDLLFRLLLRPLLPCTCVLPLLVLLVLALPLLLLLLVPSALCGGVAAWLRLLLELLRLLLLSWALEDFVATSSRAAVRSLTLHVLLQVYDGVKCRIAESTVPQDACNLTGCTYGFAAFLKP